MKGSMKERDWEIIKATGIACGAVGAASLSAYLTTKYYLKLAIDREAPRLMTLTGKLVSGTVHNSEFYKTRMAKGKALSAKACEIVQINSHDGLKLAGHWFPQSGAKRVIIAVHGWRASWADTFGIVSEAWEKNGCSILYIEQRAHDSSGGEYMGFGLLERYDCLDWARWVQSRCGEDIPIYLCGVSMGASTVLMAAGLPLPKSVHGIIADCGYTSPYAIWQHVANNNLHIVFGIRGRIADEILKHKIQVGSSDYSTVEALQSSQIPVLLIHGSSDHFVPIEMTYENYLACAGEKRLLIVPGADHGMSYFTEPKRYEAAVLDFWKEFDGKGETA